MEPNPHQLFMVFDFHSYLKSGNEIFLCRAPIDSFVAHLPLQSQRREVTCQKTHSFKKSHSLLRKESGFEHLTIRLQAQFPPQPPQRRGCKGPHSVQNLTLGRVGGAHPCSVGTTPFSCCMASSCVIMSAQDCSVPCRALGAEGSRTKLTCSLPALSPQVSWEDPTTQSDEHRERCMQRVWGTGGSI